MIKLMADANITKHVTRLSLRMQSEEWCEFWDYLEMRVVTFQEAGLLADDTDVVVWKRCQEQQIFLITNNRNDDGPDSLETTIQTLGTLDSVPVFTVGDADAILASSEYVDRVVDRLFRYLLDIDNIRGAGRLFLP